MHLEIFQLISPDYSFLSVARRGGIVFTLNLPADKDYFRAAPPATPGGGIENSAHKWRPVACGVPSFLSFNTSHHLIDEPMGHFLLTADHL
jgi:hypothetical protein